MGRENEEIQQQLEGTVVSVIYQNPENGYTVMRLDTAEGVVTAVGCMPGIGPGENILLSGQWTTHQSYGEQFKAQWAQRRMPEGRQAIYKYLSSGAIKNIGPAKAKDIVDKFGDDTLTVIESEPEKLATVRGISRKLAMQIGAWYRRQVGLRRLMELLSRYGIKPNVAVALYRSYGDEAAEAVKGNPYIIVSEDFGADFFEADAMALEMGFAPDCQERVEAALLFELRHNLNNGHVFLPREKLLDATHRLIDAPRELIAEALEALCDGGYIVPSPVAGQDACYLREIYEAEIYVARRLSEMAALHPAEGDDTQALVSRVEAELGLSYAPQQRQAIAQALECSVMVLTGGPGTGKTTAVKGILEAFKLKGLKTLLCAPTGRAAKRMSELTGHDASTVHRLLGAGVAENDRIVFEHNEAEPLECDAVIVDEMSMVDILLMHSFLSALRPGCRLIMVGDADQLPSVGPGNVFSDIIKSLCVPTVTLTEIFRQAQESRIVRCAHMINRGELPELRENSGDFFMLHRASAQKTAQTIVQLCAERLPKNMGIPPEQIQVLSPTRRHDTGTDSLNAMLQAAINPPAEGKREKAFGDFTFREGDRVMQIRNNYDAVWHKTGISLPEETQYPSFAEDKDLALRGYTESGTGIFNGDVGVITRIDLTHETMRVDFDDRYVIYDFDRLGELEPAYAMTVHKAQGSEYRAVVLAAFDGAPRLMVRSVLYTAVTRAKELLIIVGDENTVASMTANDRRQRRYSGLRARLAGEV
ncbi:MAG: AAA family ATPase [Oscillospiraceae bacterium]|nr:AAA family ATPase [Oscillospiraceae bacterium]